MSAAFFHGGPPGLREILPPTRTGVMSTLDAARMATIEPGGDATLAARSEAVIRRDRVYLTSDPDEASLFASMNPSGQPGVVYEVEPIGDVEPDPDYSGPASVVHCRRARVLRVVYRGVRLTQFGLTRRPGSGAPS
jgi:hypothetical protein